MHAQEFILLLYMLSGQEQQLNDKTMKVQLRLVNSLMHSCFKDCVHTFEADSLEKKDRICIQNCGLKLIAAYQYISEVTTKIADSKS